LSISILDAGTLRAITSGKVRVAGVTRTLRTIKVQDGGTLRTVATFASALSPTISSSSTGGISDPGPPTERYVVYNATASPGGGLGPYTYSWAIITGSGWDFVTGSTSASVSIYGDTTQSVNGSARVTVTDSLGQTGTADLSLTL
jgi:hypothetical protein